MAFPGVAELSFTVKCSVKKYFGSVSATWSDGPVQIHVRNQPEG